MNEKTTSFYEKLEKERIDCSASFPYFTWKNTFPPSKEFYSMKNTKNK